MDLASGSLEGAGGTIVLLEGAITHVMWNRRSGWGSSVRRPAAERRHSSGAGLASVAVDKNVCVVAGHFRVGPAEAARLGGAIGLRLTADGLVCRLVAMHPQDATRRAGEAEPASSGYAFRALCEPSPEQTQVLLAVMNGGKVRPVPRTDPGRPRPGPRPGSRRSPFGGR